MRLLSGVTATEYVYDNQLEVLREDFGIGEFAERVTIVLLSLDRVEHTALFLYSLKTHFPQYKGKVLIADNGSTEDSLEKLHAVIKQYHFDIFLIDMKKNYGVAGGRNRAFEQVETEYILSLDNDIFLVENPFDELNKVIRLTGAKFINLSLLDEKGEDYIQNGGHIWLNQTETGFFASCGPFQELKRYKENTRQNFTLSTFIFGGAALYHKDTFFDCGKFDEKYFVGFEDLDFSLTVLEKGYKVANCGLACLVHNHPKTELVEDYDVKRNRYSVIKESAKYFYEKNGVSVWDKETEKYFCQLSKKLPSNRICTYEERLEHMRGIYAETLIRYRQRTLISGSIQSDEEREIVALKKMVDELRSYSHDLENEVNGLSALQSMLEELRNYSKDLEMEKHNLIEQNDLLRNELNKFQSSFINWGYIKLRLNKLLKN